MSKLIKVTAIFLFFFVFSTAYSQDKSIDSFKVLLQNPKLHDTVRLELISQIIENVVVGDSVSRHYNDIVKKIVSKKLKDKNLNSKEREIYLYSLAYWYCDKSTELFSKKNGKLIINYYDRAIAIFKFLKKENEQWITVNNKGYALRKLNDFDGAISCFYSALKHQEAIGNKLGVSASNSAIAVVYEDQKKYEKALSFYLKGLSYYDSLSKPSPQDLTEQATIINNIGNVYYNLKKYELSKNYIIKSLRIKEQNGSPDNTSYGYKKLGDIDLIKKKYEDAIKNYNKGMSFAKKDRSRAYLFIGLGEAYFELNNLSKSEDYILKAMALAEPIGDLDLLETCYNILYQINKKKPNYKLSLEMLEKFHQVKDSNNTEESRNALEQQQIRYDFEKKELNYKLETQKKNEVKNNWLIALSATLLLLVLGSYFYYKNNKQKQAISQLEKNQIKQKLLISQMNPHFIFNSIDNIKSLIHNKKDIQAVNYLTKFSSLTRQILENSNENYISLQEEITMLENYLVIQQLLYTNKFDFTICVSSTIDKEATYIPPMLTQPFIENAIKHGLKNKDKNGRVAIHFFKNESKLFFEVTDNGNGFNKTDKEINHKSLAVAMTKKRLEYYTKKSEFLLQMENITDANEKIIGAKINFEIPYIYEN